MTCRFYITRICVSAFSYLIFFYLIVNAIVSWTVGVNDGGYGCGMRILVETGSGSRCGETISAWRGHGCGFICFRTTILKKIHLCHPMHASWDRDVIPIYDLMCKSLLRTDYNAVVHVLVDCMCSCYKCKLRQENLIFNTRIRRMGMVLFLRVFFCPWGGREGYNTLVRTGTPAPSHPGPGKGTPTPPLPHPQPGPGTHMPCIPTED